MLLKYNRILAICAIVMLGVGLSFGVSAGEYAVTNLDDARLSYSEHRFDINDSGRFCYTDTAGVAWISDQGAAGVALPTISASRASVSEGINDTGHVVGYGVGSQPALREAVAWRSTGGTSYALVDLHAGLPTGGANPASWHSSAAYEISNTAPGSPAFLAVGYAREGLASGPQAVIWGLNSSLGTISYEFVPTSSGMNYNLAYAVNDDGIVGGGEGTLGGNGGGGAGTALYAFVYDSVSNALTPVPGVQASDGFQTSVVTALNDTHAVGYAVNSSGVVGAFVHELGTSTTNSDVRIGDDGGSRGPRSMGFGLATAADGSPIVLGTSEVGGVGNTSIDGMVFDDNGDNPQECAVGWMHGWSGRITHIFAMNDNGQGVGIGTELISDLSDGLPQTAPRVVYFEDDADRSLNNTVYFRQPGDGSMGNHIWVDVTDTVGTPGAGSSALFIASNARGCGSGYTCDSTSELSDEGTVGVDYEMSGTGAFSGSNATTGRVFGDLSDYTYIQVISDANNGCQVGDVEELSGLSITTNPAGTDPWGTDWADCDGGTIVGAETNVSTNSAHCGTCNNSVSDGLACTDDICSNGSPQNTYDTGSNYCWIGSDCIPPGTENPAEECEACVVGSNRYGYTDDANGTACADDGFTCTTSGCSGGDCDPQYAFTGCLIGGSCRTYGSANPSNECQNCNASNNTNWSNDATGTSCTDSDGLWCTTPGCNSGTCDQDQNGYTGCLISSSCHTNNVPNPSNECQHCDVASPTSWTNDANGTACNGNVCISGQTCNGSGSCTGGTYIMDGYEPNDSTSQYHHFGSYHEDHSFPTASLNNTLTIHTLPSNNDDYFSFYVDDWHCNNYTYSCNPYSCNCDWLGNNCSTCWNTCTGQNDCHYGGSDWSDYDSGASSENPRPRVQMIPPAGSDYDLCVALRCNYNGASPSVTLGSGTATGTMVVGGSTVTRYCSTAGTGTTENVTFNNVDCATANDSVLVGVRVYKFGGTGDCDDTYNLAWGDQ